MIQNCIARPDEPDSISTYALREYYSHSLLKERGYYGDEEFVAEEYFVLGRMTGIDLTHSRAPTAGEGLTMRRRYRGPRTILTSLNFAFPGIFNVLRCIPALDRRLGPWYSDSPLAMPHTDGYTIKQDVCNRQYRLLSRLHSDLQEVTDAQIREEAVLQGFRLCGVDAVEVGVHIKKWADALVKDDDDETASTPTPDMLSMIEEIRVATPSVDSSDHRPEPVWGQVIPTVFRDDIDEATRTRLLADVPPPPMLTEREVSEMTIIPEERTHEATDPVALQTLLEPASPEPLLDASQLQPPSTPAPGISRARSLPLDMPAVPVRRPTELDESIGTVAEGLWPSLHEIGSAEPWELSTYRVTHLSLVPAELFALLASNMATSVLMLPFDIYYARLLTRSFLSATPLGARNIPGNSILHDIWPLSPWSGLQEMGLSGSLNFASRVFITFGIQSVVSTILWKGTVWLAQRQGQQRYGWGQF